MPGVRYLITGGSGFIGGQLIEELSGREETELIVNVDVKPPQRQSAKTEFVKGDVRDFGAMRELMERKQINSLVHLAFLLNPIRDENLMYDIDVNGTERVLRAAAETGVEHVVVTTSAIAYGAWPDNPRPIAEDHPVRGLPDFSYGRDKAEADRVCQLWAHENPDKVMTIVRPSIVFGPGVDNFIYRTWENSPFLPILDGVDEQVQFVHNEDVAQALILLLDAKAPGPYNLAADGLMTWGQCAGMVGLKTREMPYKRAYRLFDWSWRLHLPKTESPAGVLATIRYPWIVSNEKLKAAVGWEPKYTSQETFELTMRAKGKLLGTPAPQATTSPVA
jgi:UDP-glucose 4-epimerase